jgi:hypothetical protein
MTRRTIHDMTRGEIGQKLVDAAGDGIMPSWVDVAEEARRLAGPDPRPLVEALLEINRRTTLLVHQNTGRWDMSVEHDQRTINVLNSNFEIARKALEAWEDAQ